MAEAAAKRRIPPVFWVLFGLVDLVIVAVVLVALFWVAPVPPAFAGTRTLEQARQVQPTGLAVAVVTSDACLACQMYKRGALTDQRFTDWVRANAGAAYLKWGADTEQIESLGVDRFPATVVVTGDEVLATHYGPMNTDELLAFLDAARAELGGAGAAPGTGDPDPDPAQPAGAPQPPAGG
ncbi:MAG: hypothetical protein KDA05_01845 [Phycisphaerales bacterium]|nr:hypothetical protein [Phycisphaerales bacterium]MCB9840953.1 hypothetical protein [Phycisphaeraceae bacterium]